MAADRNRTDERAVVDTHARSVVKGLVWRMLATLATIALVYGFTGKPMIAMEVGGLEVIVKLLLYYGHERAWNGIRWGRRELAVVQVEAGAAGMTTEPHRRAATGQPDDNRATYMDLDERPSETKRRTRWQRS